jgi:DNA replication initiation complex subunit (GINS family)
LERLRKMITYQDIYDLLRKEKYSEELQPLPKSFFKDVAAYINDKKEIITKEHDIFSEAIIKTKKQLDNTIELIKEIVLRRKKKILNLAFIASETGISKKDFDNMLPHEKELFQIVAQQLEKAGKDINNSLNGTEAKEFKNRLIKFKANVNSFIDANDNILGPFKEGEIANLPAEIVQILIQEGKAEAINEEE